LLVSARRREPVDVEDVGLGCEHALRKSVTVVCRQCGAASVSPQLANAASLLVTSRSVPSEVQRYGYASRQPRGTSSQPPLTSRPL
jgi:hypothetical protein